MKLDKKGQRKYQLGGQICFCLYKNMNMNFYCDTYLIDDIYFTAMIF